MAVLNTLESGSPAVYNGIEHVHRSLDMPNFNLAQTLYALTEGVLYEVVDATTHQSVMHYDYVAIVPSRIDPSEADPQPFHLDMNMVLKPISLLPLILDEEELHDVVPFNMFERMMYLAKIPNKRFPKAFFRHLLIYGIIEDVETVFQTIGYEWAGSPLSEASLLMLDTYHDGKNRYSELFKHVFFVEDDSEQDEILTDSFIHMDDTDHFWRSASVWNAALPEFLAALRLYPDRLAPSNHKLVTDIRVTYIGVKDKDRAILDIGESEIKQIEQKFFEEAVGSDQACCSVHGPTNHLQGLRDRSGELLFDELGEDMVVCPEPETDGLCIRLWFWLARRSG